MIRQRRRHVAVSAAAALVAALLVLTACGTIRSTIKTRSELRRAGFSVAGVTANEHNGITRVTVRLRSPHSEFTEREAAAVVWRTFEYRVDEVEVASTDQSVRFSRAVLERGFGPRPSSLDRHTIGSDFRATGRTAAIVVAIGGVLFLLLIGAVVVVVVVYLRRRERRGPAAAPPGPPLAPPPPGYGQWPPPPSG